MGMNSDGDRSEAEQAVNSEYRRTGEAARNERSEVDARDEDDAG